MAFGMALTYWDIGQPTQRYQNPRMLAIESTLEATSVAGNMGKTTVRFSEPQEAEEFRPVQIQRQTRAGLDRKAKE